MRSSISSSEPRRPWPEGPWSRIVLVALVLFGLAVVGWEAYWRAQWLKPSTQNSDGLWALTRDRIDDEGGKGTVILGSSRVLFDLNLETWQQETGSLPIQLALEGTSPRPFLKHVARETSFAGLVIVGITEVLFFNPDNGLRASALERYRTRSVADRWSHQLSMRLVEPVLAFYDPDTALFTVLRRQPFWPGRNGQIPSFPVVRKLSNTRRTRHTEMWDRVELDPAYREIARGTWLTMLKMPPPNLPPPEVMRQQMLALLDDVAGDVEAIRARGGEVVFVRCPSTGPFLEAERMALPRERTWDPLLARADAVGIHFEDHADLQGFDLPEWSHISAAQTPRFTRAVIAHLREALAARGTPRPELGGGE